MWEFFQWAWNLDWGEGFALLAVLFAFYYGKKWIDISLVLLIRSKQNIKENNKRSNRRIRTN